ncbi:MAG: hypothetical protein P8Y44_09890 [Acidobacteriota bacterium]
MKNPTLALLLALAAGTAAVEAGVVYDIEVTDHQQSPPTTEGLQMVTDGKNIAMDIPPQQDSGSGKAIFKGDEQEMVIVNDDTQSYMVIDKAAVDGIATQLNDVMKQMDEMLKNLPQEQQDAIKKAQAGGMGSTPGAGAAPPLKAEVKRTDERGDQGGYPCVKYEVLLDGKKIRELWVTDWANVEGGSEASGAFEKMGEFFEELTSSMPDLGQGAGPDMDFAETFSHGFPVLSREFDPETGDLESESALRGAKKQSIDPDAFEPPSGYQRTQMFQP